MRQRAQWARSRPSRPTAETSTATGCAVGSGWTGHCAFPGRLKDWRPHPTKWPRRSRPSEVEPLLERAGQRAAEVERQAAQDIEVFTQGQMAEAEAESFTSAAEAVASSAEAAAAAEAGGGALAAIGSGLAAAGEAALPVAATVGLAVAGAGRRWWAPRGRCTAA